MSNSFKETYNLNDWSPSPHFAPLIAFVKQHNKPMTETQKRAIALLPIIQAAAEGKTIQYQYQNEWRDSNNLQFLERIEYRIKPEPREFWIDSNAATSNTKLAGWIHVREILD